MKHLSKIILDFAKLATIPEWWQKLSIKDQKEYIRQHPHTNLWLVYPKKEINGVKVSKIDARNSSGMSFISYAKNITKNDILKTFGTPNAKSKKYGDEWIVRIGPHAITIYGYDNNTIHIGGSLTKEDITPWLQKIFPQIKFSDKWSDLE